MMPVSFIADVMLGRLSRWLRLLGFDTLYRNDFIDREILRIGRQQGRIILTRDSGILRSRICTLCVAITKDSVRDQLLEVARYLGCSGFCEMPQEPRCPICNGLVGTIPRKALLQELPEHVRLENTAFFRCSECGKVYWNGSHATGISAMRSAFHGEISAQCVIQKRS